MNRGHLSQNRRQGKDEVQQVVGHTKGKTSSGEVTRETA